MENKNQAKDNPEFYSFGGEQKQQEQEDPRLVSQPSKGSQVRKASPKKAPVPTHPSFFDSFKDGLLSVFGRKKKTSASATMAHYICYYDSIGESTPTISKHLGIEESIVIQALDEAKQKGLYDDFVKDLEEIIRNSEED